MFTVTVDCPSNEKIELKKECKGYRRDGVLNIQCSRCPAYQAYVATIK